MNIADDHAPLVSSVMPTSDRRAFVPMAIRAFARQDNPERELIIVDDGRGKASVTKYAEWPHTRLEGLHGKERPARPGTE
jgi:hypothetical protein